MLKLKGSDLLAVGSACGVFAWVLTYYWGGMTFFLLAYYYIVIPFLIAYFYSLLTTIKCFKKNGWALNKIKVYSHFLSILLFCLIALSNSELFKSKRILTATLYEDLFYYQLVLRKNGNCEIRTSGWFGFGETYQGNYFVSSDTIIFLKKPYSNDFIPDTLFLNRKESAVFMKHRETKEFPTEKKYLNHFEVEFLSMK